MTAPFSALMLPAGLKILARSAVARRLAGGGFANLLGKIWLLLVQFAAIPLMTGRWGPEGYGLWLMLSTIPTYIGLSDIGLGTAAGVEMTKRVARSDYPGALNAFQSVWVFFTLAIGVIALGVAGGGALLVTVRQIHIGTFGPGDIATAIAAMAIYAAISAQTRIIYAVYRATHKYALGTVLLDAVVLLEGVAMVVVVLAGGGVAELCVTMLLIRLPTALPYYLVIKKLEPWFRLGWHAASASMLRSLLHPSLAAFALTCANAVILQGLILTLGWMTGAAVVAVFGAARFMTRIPLQLSGLVTRASIPELTHSQVADNRLLTRRLTLVNLASSMLATIPFAVLFMLIGPTLLDMISNGILGSDRLLFVLLAAASTLNAAWTAMSAPLVAINRHMAFSYWYLILSALCILAPFLPIAQPLLLASGGMVLVELAMVAIVFRLLKMKARRGT